MPDSNSSDEIVQPLKHGLVPADFLRRRSRLFSTRPTADGKHGPGRYLIVEEEMSFWTRLLQPRSAHVLGVLVVVLAGGDLVGQSLSKGDSLWS